MIRPGICPRIRTMVRSLAAPGLVVLLLAGSIVTGCDNGVDPLFSRQAVPPDLALLPADRAGIVVQPVSGVSEPFATDMAAAAADALQANNVPASLRGGASSSYFLSGDMGMTALADGDVSLRVTWDLSGPDGVLIGTHEQRRNAPAPGPQTGALLESLAAEAAPRIAAMIQGDAPPPPIAEAVAEPSAALSIGAIDGAPGDGARNLQSALVGSLPLYGVLVARGDLAASTLTGEITMTDVNAATQHIRLVWRVIDASGAELGRLDQENDIAAGSLDGAWGEVAYFIAEGVASGVAQILARTGG